MKEIKIDHLAYLLKEAKKNKQPQPIFFLGAGASRSGNIPLAGEIIKQILNDYADNPFIKDLPEEGKTYAKLMDCLLPDQRDELLKKYIDEAKINVTHIYLAQLLKEGFVDYVLTVNFDNLMLRSLALFNIFPATYDMAILKDFTTSTFKEKSVVYLHGQNHGLWLLNTSEEMKKVKNTVPRIFDTIKNKRPWVFIGYSGEDPIFDHVKNLGRFNNGLYWVTYNDNNPIESVQKFLSEPNTNAYIIKGYDADSFMLKLNSELELTQPNIVDKPFSALKEMLSEIVDIDDEEHFKGVKERFKISNRQVDEAIQQFELGELESVHNITEHKIDLLKKEIINLIISEQYDEKIISAIDLKVNEISDDHLRSLLSGLYSNWGTHIGISVKTEEAKEAEESYYRAIEKYQKAIEIKPDSDEAFYNWGLVLGDLARIKDVEASKELYLQAFEKYQKALTLNPSNHEAYNNWGVELGNLAEIKNGKESEGLFHQSFEKFKKAIEINKNNHRAYNNWAVQLGKLARKKERHDADNLYEEAFEKYQIAIDIKSDYDDALINWGITLGFYAKNKEENEGIVLLNNGIEKLQLLIKIRPYKIEAYNNLGVLLGDLAQIKKSDEIYNQAYENFQIAIAIKPDMYEAFFNWGNLLGRQAKMKKGNESAQLYIQAFQKFKNVLDLKPNFQKALEYWGTILGYFAQSQLDDELFQQSIEKLKKAIELGGSSFNLSCIYAIKGEKENALFYLNQCLSKNEISADDVEKDPDWASFLEDPEFKEILATYRT